MSHLSISKSAVVSFCCITSKLCFYHCLELVYSRSLTFISQMFGLSPLFIQFVWFLSRLYLGLFLTLEIGCNPRLVFGIYFYFYYGVFLWALSLYRIFHIFLWSFCCYIGCSNQFVVFQEQKGFFRFVFGSSLFCIFVVTGVISKVIWITEVGDYLNLFVTLFYIFYYKTKCANAENVLKVWVMRRMRGQFWNVTDIYNIRR